MDAVQRARALAEGLRARAEEADREGALPEEDVRALREAGYFALSVPRTHGGGGLSLLECVRAQLELSQGSTATALVAAMPLQLFGHAPEARLWEPAAYERLCALAGRGALINAAASEPGLGSPSRGGLPMTTARLEGEELVIDGHKTWVTGGRRLTHLLVQLRLEDEVAVVLVDNHLPGLRWQESWQDALSLRASDSHDVFFEEVRVPVANLVQRGKTPGLPNAWFLLLVAATYLGSALEARRSVVAYARERVPTALGKPIASLPQVQRQVGELEVLLDAAQTLLLDVVGAWSRAPSENLFARVATAKHLATETAVAVTEKALRIAGGASLTGALPLARLFRDARAGLMHPPSGDAALERVGRAVLEVDTG